MAIGTYAELQTAVANWMARDDIAARIIECIALFEAFMNRRLIARPMTTTTPLTPAGGSVALPADYLTPRRLTWTGSPTRQLQYVTPDYFYARYTTAAAEPPTIYTIEGDTLLINSTDISPLTLGYNQKVPALSDSATANWLLTAHPDLYLFGSLTEGNAYAQDAQTAALWKARRDEVLDELWKLTFRGPIGAIRPAGATP